MTMPKNSDPSTRSTNMNTGAGRIEYFEVISSPKWMRFSFYIIFGTLIGFFLFFPLWSQEPDNPTNLFLCIVFTFALLAFINFFSLRVTIFSDRIQFGFYIYNKQFEYEAIKSCKIIQYPQSDYFNIGPKDGPDGATYYTVPGQHQQGIKIIVEENNMEPAYVFIAKRPEVVYKRILAKIPQEQQKTPMIPLPEE